MPSLKSLFIAAIFLAAPAIGMAQEDAPGEPPVRMSTLVVFGNDPCPKSSGDEIIVCARLPESDRFRIPKRFRHKEKPDEGGDSWASRARTLDVVSQRGLPDSCSPIGSGGQTGCFRKFRQQWAAEQRAAKEAGADVP